MASSLLHPARVLEASPTSQSTISPGRLDPHSFMIRLSSFRQSAIPPKGVTKSPKEGIHSFDSDPQPIPFVDSFSQVQIMGLGFIGHEGCCLRLAAWSKTFAAFVDT